MSSYLISFSKNLLEEYQDPFHCEEMGSEVVRSPKNNYCSLLITQQEQESRKLDFYQERLFNLLFKGHNRAELEDDIFKLISTVSSVPSLKNFKIDNSVLRIYTDFTEDF